MTPFTVDVGMSPIMRAGRRPRAVSLGLSASQGVPNFGAAYGRWEFPRARICM